MLHRDEAFPLMDPETGPQQLGTMVRKDDRLLFFFDHKS